MTPIATSDVELLKSAAVPAPARKPADVPLAPPPASVVTAAPPAPAAAASRGPADGVAAALGAAADARGDAEPLAAALAVAATDAVGHTGSTAVPAGHDAGHAHGVALCAPSGQKEPAGHCTAAAHAGQ